MKKLLILGLFALFLSSCDSDTFSEDPSLKESERIAVLQKAKTDTLLIAVDMDNHTYIVKEGKIVSYTSNSMPLGAIWGFGVLVGLVIGVFICAMASNEY